MSLKHIVFIVNPKSGTERRKEIETAVRNNLDDNRFSYEIQETQFAKHGTQLAKEAAHKGAYGVVAVGGDGSVNDIVAGLADSKTILGIIPKGSGNGMARTMGIPLNADDAVKVINRDQVQAIDVAYANDRLFVSNAGVAFDALISRKFAKSERRGLPVYSWLVTKHLWLYKVWDFTLTIDGKELKERAFMVTVANGKQFGYNFQIAPMADYTDGKLDVIIIRKFPKLLGGLIAMRAMSGTITKSPYVKHYTATEVTITHPNLRLMQTDGDAHDCSNEIKFSIKPAAQRVFVP